MKNIFKDFNLNAAIQQTLDSMGFTEPTEIQKKAIPAILAQQKIDVHGQAQTGTGKTLAFGIPLLHRINKESKKTQALIVAPTRELALQIYDSLKPFAQAMGISIEAIVGGMSMESQMRNLKKGAHIVVGTPGRLNDHVRRRTLDLMSLVTLVLDEADIMLDMGFKEEVDEILACAAKDREIWLFSATVKPGIKAIMRDHMTDPLSVCVAKSPTATVTTKQYFCTVPMKSRLAALCRFIESAPEFYAFIFCQTKILTSEIAEQLLLRGYKVGALHGDMSQAQRNLVIKKFKNKELTIVVATDVAARGIDIANLTHVVNYSLPEDHESYVHRVGRTGRAGKEGVAITFISRSETRLIQMLQRKFNFVIEPVDVPSKEQILQGRIAQIREQLERQEAPAKLSEVPQEFQAMLAQLTEEQLRTHVGILLYEKFLSTFMQEEDIVSTPSRLDVGSENQQELYITVGSDDPGLTKEAVMDHLLGLGVVQEDQVIKIRSIKRRTFIEVVPEKVAAVIDALQGTMLAGRRIRAQMVEPEGAAPRRNNERHGRSGGRGRNERSGYRGRSQGRSNDRGGYRGGRSARPYA